MTISTRRTDRPSLRPRPGFTLAEIMIAATITGFVLVGVLSAFLMIGRSEFLASSYSELEAETRRGLEIFGEDARKATNLQWNSAQSVTLFVATTTDATLAVTYAYDADASSPTAGCFYRVLGLPDSTQARFVLVHRVAADFAFARYKLEQPDVADNTAATDLETKELQVTLRASRVGATTVAANQTAVSSRYILLNKRVTN